MLVFERKAGSRASSRNKSESHGNDTEQDLCKRRQRENSLRSLNKRNGSDRVVEGYEKYASRIQELLFDGMDVHEVWVYMKVMFQIEKNEICFRAYLERSGLIWFAEAGSRRQVKVPDLLETKRKLEMNRTKISKPLCKYPDCFRCVYPDCTCNEGLTKKGNDELVRELAKR